MYNFIKFIVWQIKQAQKPSPDPESWAYRIRVWWYARTGPKDDDDVVVNITGLSFPADMTVVTFENNARGFDLVVSDVMVEQIKMLSNTMKDFAINVNAVRIEFNELKEALDEYDRNNPVPWGMEDEEDLRDDDVALYLDECSEWSDEDDKPYLYNPYTGRELE